MVKTVGVSHIHRSPSMSSRYASYWNAFLFVDMCKLVEEKKPPLIALLEVVNHL